MLICRYLWLLVGLTFCFSAFAETQPAIPGTYDPTILYWADNHGGRYTGPTPESVCNTGGVAYTGGGTLIGIIPRSGGFFWQRICRMREGANVYDYYISAITQCRSGDAFNNYTGLCTGLTCPDSSWTLNGTQCERVEPCPSGQREWNGECRPECDAMQTVNSETGNCECSSMRKPLPSPSVSGPGATPETTCYGGCSYKLGDMALNLGGKEWFSDLGAPTGQTCSAGQGESEKPLPETKEPPCAPGEGVGTSSSGKVLCVPEGTPNAPKPDVQKTVKKETYPDGSEKTTETTKTKDPTTGATDTKSTSTSTGGMAGPAGTTTTTETSTGDGKEPGQGDGDGDGDCEGDDCGGGEGFKGPEGDLYEKKDRTMRDALEDFSAAVSDSPVMVAARNWFSIGGMPASCGGLSVTVPYLDTTISADSIFCGEYGALIMQIAGAVVLAAAAYAGFRIAIL